MITDNKLRAALFALAAVGTASLQDAIVKSFSGDFPATQILVFRALGSAPLLLWLLFRDGEWRKMRPAQSGLLLARSAILRRWLCRASLRRKRARLSMDCNCRCLHGRVDHGATGFKPI
jgi:hypothetical protein